MLRFYYYLIRGTDSVDAPIHHSTKTIEFNFLNLTAYQPPPTIPPPPGRAYPPPVEAYPPPASVGAAAPGDVKIGLETLKHPQQKVETKDKGDGFWRGW